MTYKLLIADDEPKIRNGLRKMLDYESFGIKVVGEAEDGEIALQRVVELQPNILFLDICMPFLNGLELVKKIRQKDQDCLIVIISGYDQYSYMQEAIRLQVFDYLLKPISKEKMKQTIGRLLSELKKQSSREDYSQWASERLDENIDVVRQTFFQKLIKASVSEERIAVDLKYLKFQFSNKIGISLFRVKKRNDLKLSGDSLDNDLMLYGIRNMVSEFFGPASSVCFMDDYQNIVILANTKSVAEWARVCSEMHKNMESYINAGVIYECNVTQSLNEISGLYRKLACKVKEQSQMKPVTVSILQYIKAHYYDRSFSVEQTAEKYRITSSYLSKLLKTETGYSFVDVLTMIRVQKAMEMIDSTALKIYEIAELVGYSNQYYFSRAFKKIAGCSPVQYREGKRDEREA